MTLVAERKKIKDMEPGEEGYTVPWSVFYDKDNKPWLDFGGFCAYSSFRHGDLELKIKRTKRGFTMSTSAVNPLTVEHTWDPGWDPEHYRQQNSEDILPLKKSGYVLKGTLREPNKCWSLAKSLGKTLYDLVRPSKK